MYHLAKCREIYTQVSSEVVLRFMKESLVKLCLRLKEDICELQVSTISLLSKLNEADGNFNSATYEGPQVPRDSLSSIPHMLIQLLNMFLIFLICPKQQKLGRIKLL